MWLSPPVRGGVGRPSYADADDVIKEDQCIPGVDGQRDSIPEGRRMVVEAQSGGGALSHVHYDENGHTENPAAIGQPDPRRTAVFQRH
jgi:hypothetical protein